MYAFQIYDLGLATIMYVPIYKVNFKLCIYNYLVVYNIYEMFQRGTILTHCSTILGNNNQRSIKFRLSLI